MQDAQYAALLPPAPVEAAPLLPLDTPHVVANNNNIEPDNHNDNNDDNEAVFAMNGVHVVEWPSLMPPIVPPRVLGQPSRRQFV